MKTKLLALFAIFTTISIGLYSCDKNDDISSDGGGKHKGHEYVDLGLPSGTKWATCNLGALNPSGIGDEFYWGQTPNGNKVEFTGKFLGKDKWDYEIWEYTLNITSDAANVCWGGNWRMPTATEFTELLNKCKWIRSTENSVFGYKIVGPNGNHIFLPRDDEDEPEYWTSTLDCDWKDGDNDLALAFTDYNSVSDRSRYLKLCIRPVLK